ncbi:hypothetical protein EB796_009871 [Bugula neritina]|uniref:lysozyme n=1 Tax=Bugula neritina TaxID=10212 RepID=A0A7J7JZK3_BUGNE|nr:hypothetical protein EB796_009871 [Bugula neritina]
MEIPIRWRECAKDLACAEKVIKRFFATNAQKCADDLNKSLLEDLTCSDYMRLHTGGPGGCGSKDTLKNVNAINKCMENI